MQKQGTIPRYKTGFAMIIVIFMVIYPWISYLKIEKLSEKAQRVFENYSGYVFDFFLNYKAAAVIGVAVFLLAVLIGENIFPDHVIKETPVRNRKNKGLYVCMGIYACGVIVSALLSKNHQTAWEGSPAEGEGAIVLISYLVLFLGAMNYFCYDKALAILKKGILILSVITILLTMVEFFYKPLLELPFAKYLMAPAKYRSIAGSMENTSYTSSVALTFYNPNYYGGFCMLLFPFGFSGYLHAQNKKQVIGYLFLSIGIFFCVLSAKSSASFYLVLLEIPVLCLLMGKGNKMLKKIILWVAAGMVLFLAFNTMGQGKLLSIGKNVLTNESSANSGTEIFRLTDIRLDGDTLALCGQEDTLYVQSQNDALKFYDTENQNLDYTLDSDMNVHFPDERYQMITMYYQSETIVFEMGYDDVVDFYLEDDTFYGIGQNGEKIDSVSLENRIGESFYSLFTGRGYTWMTSLSLLPGTILVGKGAGNFAYYFPQNDYVGLLNTHGSHKFIVDKPHNFYLQMWINEGGIALLAFIVFVVFLLRRYLFWRFGKNNRKKSDGRHMADWIFVSVAAFLIYSGVNDSIVTVTPMFWILAGVLLSLLYREESLEGMRK